MTLHRRLAALAGAALALMLAGEAVAQVPLDESLDEHSAKRLDRMEKAMRELRAIVFQGRETGQPVVVQPAETQGQLVSLSDRLNDLDQTLSRLNGQIEVIRHDLDLARQEALDLRAQNATLKDRLTALEQRPQAPPPPPPPPEPQAAAPPPQDPAEAFAAAKAAYDGGDSPSAEAAFRDYVDRFGESPRGPEARYYLGRVLLGRQAFADAATADIGAIRGWPQTRWAPEAVLDLSRALTALKKPADACQTLDELAKRYPKAAPSVKSAAGDLRAQARCG
ncbi:MAG: tetratricopeptide repeat protein [Caulobacteraceae bacterium]